jgi:hypothetical protein
VELRRQGILVGSGELDVKAGVVLEVATHLARAGNYADAMASQLIRVSDA